MFQVATREAADAANKAARAQAADNIYQKLKLEQEAALRAKVNCEHESDHVQVRIREQSADSLSGLDIGMRGSLSTMPWKSIVLR
jgi:hypothetical protein